MVAHSPADVAAETRGRSLCWSGCRLGKITAVPMNEPLRLDPQTRRWLKLEVSRRRKEKELHVGRPVLYRYSEQRDKRTSTSLDATAFLDEVGA